MQARETSGNEKVRIMVVEDSSTQAAQLKYVLERHDYKVRVVNNGMQALSSIREEPPDIIISDIVMPEMDGYKLCQTLKEDDDLKDIPVILMTSLSNPSDVITGLQCGANNFILKPYDERFLLSRIQYILVNQELRKNTVAEMGLEIFFAGQKHFITSDRMQIIDLLFATFDGAIQRDQELERVNKELNEALETIKTLRGFMPVCAQCKKVRNDQGHWQRIEERMREHSQAEFSHALCPACESDSYSEVTASR